ncbi:MAG: hypothetical protein GY856_55315 [bacterium]|nr:hypothetical protein [bacterium]
MGCNLKLRPGAGSGGEELAVYDKLRQGKQRLDLAQEISIALPTEREAARLWM